MATRARPNPPANPRANAAAIKPPWAIDACVVALTLAATLWAILGHEPGPERVAGTRSIAMLLVVLYGATHAIVLLRARSFQPRDRADGASRALRVSCLDLAIYWLLIYLLAPHFL